MNEFWRLRSKGKPFKRAHSKVTNFALKMLWSPMKWNAKLISGTETKAKFLATQIDCWFAFLKSGSQNVLSKGWQHNVWKNQWIWSKVLRWIFQWFSLNIYSSTYKIRIFFCWLGYIQRENKIDTINVVRSCYISEKYLIKVISLIWIMTNNKSGNRHYTYLNLP